MSLSHNCPCTEQCPMQHAMDMIGGKWKLSILCSLSVDGKVIIYNTQKGDCFQSPYFFITTLSIFYNAYCCSLSQHLIFSIISQRTVQPYPQSCFPNRCRFP